MTRRLPPLAVFSGLPDPCRRGSAWRCGTQSAWSALVPSKEDSMLFCSQAFFLFFTVIFLVYWAVRWQQLRVWLLTAASFYFYAKWNEWLALLICISTAMDYLIAL